MDIYLIQTEPTPKQIKLVDTAGIRVLRGKPTKPPLEGNLLFRLPQELIAPFMGAMKAITDDYSSRLEAIAKKLKSKQENEL